MILPFKELPMTSIKNRFIFNDYLFKLKRSGKVLARGHFHTGREFEGISINGRHLYAELAQRPELLRQRIR